MSGAHRKLGTIINGYKICPNCKINLPVSSYGKRGVNGSVRSWCRNCEKEREKRRPKRILTEQQRQYAREFHLKDKYGLNLDQFEKMFEDQGKCCAICKTTEPKGKYSQWQIDHDHKINCVRGILCHFCNMTIGNAFDSPIILHAAAQYLEKHKEDTEHE